MTNYKPHLNAIKKLEKQCGESILDPIMKSEKHGLCWVFSEPLVGLLVLKITFDKKTKQQGLLVWLAISTGDIAGEHNAIAKNIELINDMGKDSGSSFIEFETMRKGFIRVAPKFGFKQIGKRKQFTIYRKEV